MKKILLFILILFISLSSWGKCVLKINVSGIQGEPYNNIKNSLEDLSTSKNLCSLSPNELTDEINSTIINALKPYGYLHPKITSQELYFHITPGPAAKISKLDIQITGAGSNNKIFFINQQQQLLKIGEQFSTPNYEKTKALFKKAAQDNGYLDAKFSQQAVIINPSTNTVNIILHFDTGNQYRFGNVRFNNTIFTKYFLTKFSKIKPGASYNSKAIEDTQQALTKSNYFKNVTITTKEKNADYNYVPIDIQLTTRKKYQYNLGAGFGTDTGPRGSAEIDNRYLTNDGQYYNALLQVSQIQNTLGANYVIPGNDPVTSHYTLNATAFTQDYIYGTSNGQKLSASYTNEIHGWQQTANLTLQREQTQLLTYPTTISYMLYPSITWEKVQSDDPINPSRGYRISLTITGVPGIISNVRFLQTRLDYKKIMPVFTKNRLLLRGSVGYTFINNIDILPLSFQFFAGGSQSVRGYNYNSIGPGNSILVGSIEYRQHIANNWYLAAFFDAGSVNDTFGQNIKQGVGPGIVWVSPIGTLELTLGKALNSPGQPNSIQFSMGSDL